MKSKKLKTKFRKTRRNRGYYGGAETAKTKEQQVIDALKQFEEIFTNIDPSLITEEQAKDYMKNEEILGIANNDNIYFFLVEEMNKQNFASKKKKSMFDLSTTNKPPPYIEDLHTTLGEFKDFDNGDKIFRIGKAKYYYGKLENGKKTGFGIMVQTTIIIEYDTIYKAIVKPAVKPEVTVENPGVFDYYYIGHWENNLQNGIGFRRVSAYDHDNNLRINPYFFGFFRNNYPISYPKPKKKKAAVLDEQVQAVVPASDEIVPVLDEQAQAVEPALDEIVPVLDEQAQAVEPALDEMVPESTTEQAATEQAAVVAPAPLTEQQQREQDFQQSRQDLLIAQQKKKEYTTRTDEFMKAQENARSAAKERLIDRLKTGGSKKRKQKQHKSKKKFRTKKIIPFREQNI
uniref:Uncharacterized protein n=1 Tax=viral metagenome TaxID=1070528 RepID=A0A6C0B2U2_9ZZZZ